MSDPTKDRSKEIGIEVSSALPFLPHHAILLVGETFALPGRTQHGVQPGRQRTLERTNGQNRTPEQAVSIDVV